MKTGKFFKKAALAAAICLSLSQSVWAMPTGGELKGGQIAFGVDGIFSTKTVGDYLPAINEKTVSIQARENAIIDWNSFSLARDELLAFDTTGGAILNRVTWVNANNISEIFGTLTQTGGNPLYIINPNGILVGNGAVINATNMVLSTLNPDSVFFADFGDLTTPAGREQAASVTIQEGAKINVLKRDDPIASMYIVPVSPYGQGNFAAVGGTVTVADGVIFNLAENTKVQLVAGETASIDLGNNAMGFSSGPSVTATEKNVLSVSGSSANGQGAVFLQGGKVNISDTVLEVGDGIQIDARSSAKEMLPQNAVEINKSELSGYVTIEGGKIAIKDSALSEGSINVYARSSEEKMLPQNTVEINHSTFDTNNTINIEGGKIDVTDSDLSANLRIIAANTRNESWRGWNTVPENTVSIAKTNITGNDTSFLRIAGSKVDISNSNLKSASDNPGASLTTSDYAWTITAGKNTGISTYMDLYGETDYRLGDASHRVTLKNTVMDFAGKQTMYVAGGEVMLDGTTLKSGGDIAVVAADDAKYTDTWSTSNWYMEEYNGTANTDNLVSILGGSSISAANNAAVAGGKVSITEKSTVSADNTLSVKAGSAGRMRDNVIELTGTPGEIEISSDSKLMQNGVDITNAILNGNTAIDTSINKSDAENVAIGQMAMNELLATTDNTDTLLDATRDLVQSINQENTDRRAKAAQVVGVLQAIVSKDSLSVENMRLLLREAVHTFTPTQNANTERNNTIESTTNLGIAAATGSATNNLPQDSTTQNGNASADTTGTEANGEFTIG